jgi:hypothetical protein
MPTFMQSEQVSHLAGKKTAGRLVAKLTADGLGILTDGRRVNKIAAAGKNCGHSLISVEADKVHRM